jgi:hypothetical protein
VLMTESDRIAGAETEIRDVLESASEPISSAELGSRLGQDVPRSLIRVAIQRMIGRGDIRYDNERRYSLGPPQQPST